VIRCGVELRRQETRREQWEVECFKCREKGHKCRECPLGIKKEKVAHVAKPQKAQQRERPAHPVEGKAQEKESRVRRAKGEEAAHVARPREVQQEKWRRSSVEKLRKRAEEYCRKGIPEEAQFWELDWYMREVVALYLTCKCRRKGSHVEDNREQGVILFWKWKELSWCRCKGKVEGKVAWPREAKAQQSGAWSEELEGTAIEESSQRDVRRTFKILREVWLDIGIEKVDTHEGVTVKALLDSGTTGMFMNREMAKRHGFKMTKLERPLKVKNVDGMENSRGSIMYQVEVNVFYKNHVERMRMDVCNLGKTEVILGMPWLQAHNLEIN